MDAIASARESISLFAWTIDISRPVAKSLTEKASEGVGVTIFTRPHPANAEFINKIAKKRWQGVLSSITLRKIPHRRRQLWPIDDC